MALWRCPHCGTPQPVAARCWVCRRSSTSCASCRHFRTSVAARIGYCGLDRGRQPLTGVEIRSCWDGRPLALEEDETPAPAGVIDGQPPEAVTNAPYLSGFVLVDALPIVVPGPLEPASAAPVAAVPAVIVADPAPALDGVLWSELEA